MTYFKPASKMFEAFRTLDSRTMLLAHTHTTAQTALSTVYPHTTTTTTHTRTHVYVTKRGLLLHTCQEGDYIF